MTPKGKPSAVAADAEAAGSQNLLEPLLAEVFLSLLLAVCLAAKLVAGAAVEVVVAVLVHQP